MAKKNTKKKLFQLRGEGGRFGRTIHEGELHTLALEDLSVQNLEIASKGILSFYYDERLLETMRKDPSFRMLERTINDKGDVSNTKRLMLWDFLTGDKYSPIGWESYYEGIKRDVKSLNQEVFYRVQMMFGDKTIEDAKRRVEQFLIEWDSMKSTDVGADYQDYAISDFARTRRGDAGDTISAINAVDFANYMAKFYSDKSTYSFNSLSPNIEHYETWEARELRREMTRMAREQGIDRRKFNRGRKK